MKNKPYTVDQLEPLDSLFPGLPTFHQQPQLQNIYQNHEVTHTRNTLELPKGTDTQESLNHRELKRITTETPIKSKGNIKDKLHHNP